MGYTLEFLHDDCLDLSRGNGFIKVHEFSLPGPPTRYLKRNLTPVVDPNDKIIGWLLVFRDITEEIELTRLREDMTHMLVHDLRSPLTALVGSLWILRKDIDSFQENSQVQEMIAMAERNANRMMNMVTGLLDIAKLENGQMPLYTELISVSDLFEEILSRLAPIAIEAQIELKTEISPGLPRLKVDPEHIRRAISNLVDNALKFTPDGGQVALWSHLDEKTHPSTILIGVTDSGPGISMEAQQKLFQKFQASSNIPGRRKGTGLGLAYCKLVVEAHEGEIWVQSDVGQGSTFIMRLPIERQ
jgi:signal transduction histidine kinase